MSTIPAQMNGSRITFVPVEPVTANTAAGQAEVHIKVGKAVNSAEHTALKAQAETTSQT